MTKKLQRSDDRVFGGVCAGFAEYMDFDPVAVRLGYAALTIFTAFAGIPFYIVAWIIIPAKNSIVRP
ncbi:MAG: PspC domain-containing protein [Prevotella sp.]|nr:PspC domain-containing protein [Prevotella sp.]